MGESRYEISQTAYVKLVLHALKHKTSAVNGILVGRVKQSPISEDNNSINTEAVEIIDIIPLSHSQLGLLPTLAIAITQMMDEKAKIEAEVAEVQTWWNSERFRLTQRPYTTKDVVRLRGTMRSEMKKYHRT